MPNGAAEPGMQRDSTGEKPKITEQWSCGSSPELEKGIFGMSEVEGGTRLEKHQTSYHS